MLAGWRRLHDAHALVLDGDEIRMANPFSAVPTPYRVEAGGRSWYGELRVGRVRDLRRSSAARAGSSIATSSSSVRDCRPDDEALVFQALVPASHWWDDIVYT